MAKQRKSVDSPVGKAQLDNGGSAIGVVRVNPESSYPGIPLLLKEVIDRDNGEAWAKIKAKIDYTYDCLVSALDSLEGENSFYQEVKKRAESGQKLLFKPNLVGPTNIDRHTHGPGYGDAICTDWSFIAALVIFPTAFIAGIQFPLLISLLGKGAENVGKHTGMAYAANTLGAIIGSLAGGFGLLPVFGQKS